ncbi:MAG: hypothetical protein QME51_11545 [Planctomycetota bacterium]|nr:hypothetical protein [Planctomycetota bacterium]
MKALALLSGGLDSTLAIKVLLEQGVEISALHFTSVFCRCDGNNGCGSSAKAVTDRLNIPIHNINNTSVMIESVKRPKYGYGSNVNPCIDCRINMFRSARKYMDETGAGFIVTGEVLGQRPMSQHLPALKLIEKESGLEGLILRPLSARLLEPTIPEKNKWVDREKLLAIRGRSRKEQISLAELFEIKDYPCPAGGCLLTDPAFAEKMRDLLKYNPDFGLNDVLLLQVGRHFRLNYQTKLIVGRNEKENQDISTLSKPEDILLEIVDYPGPVSLLRRRSAVAGQNPDDVILSAGITARYADIPAPPQSTKIQFRYCKGGGGGSTSQDWQLSSQIITAFSDTQIDVYRVNQPG